jgi:SAM-dependent methyltransferase
MTSLTWRAREVSIQAIHAALGAAFDWWLHIDCNDSKQASWGHRVDPKKGFPLSRLQTLHGDALVYRSVNPVNLWRMRRVIDLKPDDVFVDIGCGKGRIVCYMARQKIRKAIGIEFDAPLAEVATRNAATLRRPHAPIEIRCGDAALADYTEATVLLFYYPFGPDTMRAALAQIERSLQANPRDLTIVYYDAEFPETTNACRWLTLERQFQTNAKCTVQIFRHRR